ncbi:hypothetical protein GTP91_05110 [Rugamonas sp. FT82W]|uniref:Restriction endonuclease type IV Mrr domain-containing protein n=1 Tax=Duganella vulcania TaxID=2692166 RepID=A0A845G0K4_9BURK|nr:restriction endonuclease [Duganella vulcania]MYM86557.1 hypothetical protein [Duganella vulcania]
MPNYDFKQLSPHDFEQLSRDLIQARDQITLESFKTGRDGGIDFRYARRPDATIVQCKHYAETGLSGLLRDLRTEAKKVFKLQPSRYILVTSVGLSPKNKADIQMLFGEILNTGDIVGRDDINNLLGQYEAIEQNHYKLWLASRAMLDRVLHNASVVQSKFEVERIHRDIMRYVQSDAYPRARTMLSNDHAVIISGLPGVGKSTLAKMLLYTYIGQGYEPVSILTDFESGRERFQRGKKQIFYFDDFIGATFLGERASAFTRNEDRAILDFIEMVKSSPTTLLVMTTREHILTQAIAASEKLKHSDLISSRCVLEIGDYSVRQRAQILYNHIYFSDLPEDYRTVLLRNRFYQEIIKHKKFNPRLIEWLSTYRRVKVVEPLLYEKFVADLLEDPTEIWRYAYEQQISEAARSVLLALYTYGGQCAPDVLEHAFHQLHSLRAQRYGFRTTPSDWRSALAELHGSFIRPGGQIEVVNPSVLDMLNSAVREDTTNALDMLEGAVRFSQVRRVWNFAAAEAQAVLALLNAEADRVTAVFERLLYAPHHKLINGKVVPTDDSPDIRVSTLLHVAETIAAKRLYELTVAGLERLLTAWDAGDLDISNGISLLSQVATSKLEFHQPGHTILPRIITALTLRLSTGCRYYEIGPLLSALGSMPLSSEQEALLQKAAQVFRKKEFNGALWSCSTRTEFDNLESTLQLISERARTPVGRQIHEVRKARTEFEERETARADDMYDEWKEQFQEMEDGDSAIDDLFDSLRDPG